MITIYLARHGQTEENISRIFQGHLPGHLTEEGKQQAVELGNRLRDIPLDAVLSTYSGAYPFTFRQPIKHKNSL